MTAIVMSLTISGSVLLAGAIIVAIIWIPFAIRMAVRDLKAEKQRRSY